MPRTAILLAAALAAMPRLLSAAEAPPKEDPLADEKKQLEAVKIENEMSNAALQKKLRAIEAEKKEIEAKLQLQAQKLQFELAEKEAELKRLTVENGIQNQRLSQQLAELEARQKRLALENNVAGEEQKKAVADLKAQQELLKLRHESDLLKVRQDKEKLQAENELLQEKLRQADLRYGAEKSELDLESKRLAIQVQRVKTQEQLLEHAAATLKSEIELRAKKDEWKSRANRDPLYLADPATKEKIVVSDRRIPLNGPIFRGMADYVTDRINYYNNESSTAPIFIVIDKSPGGSVMEGYRMVKAIERSEAPVHVIVKQFAASMAAVITTLADRSYAYPNAVLLHHEMSTVNWGNMTQLKEQLEIAKKWEQRLMVPLAKKLGYRNLEALRADMYKNNSDGDWQEFADDAQRRKWVGSVVHEIRETGIVKKPEAGDRPSWPFLLDEKRDAQGRRYVELPRLDPYDLYFIHNPDNYYR